MKRANECQEDLKPLSELLNDTSHPNDVTSQDRDLASRADSVKPEQSDVRETDARPGNPHRQESTTDQSDKVFIAPENRRGTGVPVVPGGEAYRFKPGQSGNPAGRPKTGALTRAFRALLEQPVPGDRRKRTYAQAIAERLAELAVKGYLPAVRELGDRAEGRAGLAPSIDKSLEEFAVGHEVSDPSKPDPNEHFNTEAGKQKPAKDNR